jgi:hypothetical protein
MLSDMLCQVPSPTKGGNDGLGGMDCKLRDVGMVELASEFINCGAKGFLKSYTTLVALSERLKKTVSKKIICLSPKIGRRYLSVISAAAEVLNFIKIIPAIPIKRKPKAIIFIYLKIALNKERREVVCIFISGGFEFITIVPHNFSIANALVLQLP